MAKPFKVLAIALGIVVLLLVGLAAAFALFFDPNAFRGQIAAQVKEQTGRELAINGDIGLKFFPWLGVKVSQVKLGNAPGFGDTPFAEIGLAEVSVQLLPLLHKEIRASTITLEGLKLNLARNAAGKSNWADLIQKQKEETAKPAAPETPSGPAPLFEIGGLEIKDAALDYADAQAGTHYAVQRLNFKTGALKPGKAVDLDASLKLSSTEPRLDADLKLGASLEADTAAQRYALHKLKLEVDASGDAVPGGKQSVKLTGELELDQAKGLAKFSDAKLELAGLTLTTQLEGKNLNGDTPSFTGPLTVQPFNPRTLLSTLKIQLEPADANALRQASLNANLAATGKSATLSDLKIKLDDTSLTGKLELRDFSTQLVAFALNIDQLDLDRYKSASAGGEAKAPAGKNQSFNETEVPLKALDSLNVEGSVNLGSLKVGGLKVTDVAFKLDLPKGKPKTDELTAKLYGGSIVSHSEITPGQPPRIASKATIKNVQIGPMLKDLQGKDRVTGTGDLSFEIASSGRTVGEIRKNLDGEIGFSLANGAVKGFNLGQILRQAQALRGVLRGENLPKNSTEPQQTDFAELKGHGRIVNGVLTTDYLTAASPAFRLEGEGSVDLANEQINYLAKPTVVETSEGSGGKGLEELKGLTVPIRITGSFDNPKYTVDVQEALKQKAAERVNKEVRKQEERLKGKFGDFLNRALQPKQPQQPTQPPPNP